MKNTGWFIGIAFLSLLLIGGCGLLSSDDNDDALPGTLVFSAQDEAGKNQIFTMRPDGSGLRQLTDMNGSSVQPSWSPAGQQIVFSSFNQHTSVGPALWVMNADGSGLRPLHDFEPESERTSALNGNNPRWSPGGTKIAFDLCVNCQVSTNHAIFVFDLETEQLTRLTEVPVGYQSSVPRWSPDGNRIAFIANRDYVDADTLRFRRDLYVMDAYGSNQTRVTETGYPGGYVWMNSNTLIQAVTDRDTNHKDVLLLEVETGQTTPIMENLEVRNQFWVFWDIVNQQLLTTNKNHQKLPVTIASYDLNGKILKQYQLNTSVLQSGFGFDWKVNTE
ncbi:hypothetical protein BH23BAC3_BH23BAC3_14740 [soil metagenome]